MDKQTESQLERIQLVVRRSYRLSAAPTTITQLITAIDQGDASAIQLERIIISDSNLAADFMCLGPSLGWSESGTEASMRMLIMRLGFRTIRAMALSLLAKNAIAEPEIESYSPEQYRKLCFATAVMTRYFCARLNMKSSKTPDWSADELFAVGLVSHLGAALLASHLPDVFERCQFLAKRKGLTIDQAFLAIYETPLSSLAAIVVETWKLPEVFKQTIPHLASPWKAGENVDSIVCILAAQKYAADFGYKIETWDCGVELPLEVADDIVVEEEELEAVKSHIEDSIAVYFAEPLAA